MPAAALIGAGIAVGVSSLAVEGLLRFGIDAAFVLVLGFIIFYSKQKILHRRRPLE